MVLVRRVGKPGAHRFDLRTRFRQVCRPKVKWDPQINEAFPQLKLGEPKPFRGFTQVDLPILIGAHDYRPADILIFPYQASKGWFDQIWLSLSQLEQLSDLPLLQGDR